MSFMLLGILNAQASGGGGGAAYELLESTTLSTNTASVTFSSLSAYATDYKHLQIRWVARASNASNSNSLQMELNADTGNNYARHYLTGTGSSVAVGDQTAKEYLIRMTYPASQETADTFGAGVVDLLDAFSSSKNTTARALSGSSGVNLPRISLDSGLWLNTAAITSIRLWSDGSSFLAGSRFSLYGVK
tara:strand:+ start:12292 stop:12861 length:570 start_codon:yes stop_codon:yes gene_type:complete